MLEYGLYPKGHEQLFQLQARGDAEYALVAVETAVRHQNVTAFPRKNSLFKQMLEEESYDDQSSQHCSCNDHPGGFVRVNLLLQIGFR